MHEGDWFSIWASAETAERATTANLYLAHMRWRDPKVALLTRTRECPQPDGSSVLELRNGATLDQLTVFAIMRELLAKRSYGVDFSLRSTL